MRWMRAPAPRPSPPTGERKVDLQAEAPPIRPPERGAGSAAPLIDVLLAACEMGAAAVPSVVPPPRFKLLPSRRADRSTVGTFLVAIALHGMLLVVFIRSAPQTRSDADAIPVEMVIEVKADADAGAASSGVEGEQPPETPSGDLQDIVDPPSTPFAMEPSISKEAGVDDSPEEPVVAETPASEPPLDAREQRVGEREEQASAPAAPSVNASAPKDEPPPLPSRAEPASDVRKAQSRFAPKTSGKQSSAPAHVRLRVPPTREAKRPPARAATVQQRLRRTNEGPAPGPREMRPASRTRDAAHLGKAGQVKGLTSGSSSGSATSSGADNSAYRSSIYSRIQSLRRYPESARRSGTEGSALLKFTIDATGRLMSVSMVASSGKLDLDAEALASVRRAAPFPLPPPGVDRTFPVRLTFRINE
jgi:protein TonB